MIATTTSSRAWTRTALVLLACLLLAACGRVTLFANLDERQANEVLAVLLANGITADKRSSIASDTGYQIRVNQGDFPQAMQMLQARGLPGHKYLSICDVFQRQGFVSSATEERARLQCSWQQDLERTLSSYTGVADARVHIAVPGLNDVNQVSIKFNTLPAPAEMAAGQRNAAPVMSAMSPVTLAVVAGVIALLALLVTFGNRLRVRLQGKPKPDARVWKG